MATQNLLKETIQRLTANGKTVADVKFVNTQKFSCSWETFAKIADREYDCGYGETEIYMDVVVAGEGWWLERREYDGSEWWEYKELPTQKPSGEVTESDVFGNEFDDDDDDTIDF